MEPEKTTITVGKYALTFVDERVDVLERYEQEDEASGCLLWTGPLDKDGYGLASVSGRSVRAHRLSYETRIGPIPGGLQLDHTCETRACIRPEHLEPVTNFENTVRRFLRQGVTRERAEELATSELDRWAEGRSVARYAKEQAAAVGIRRGTLVRDGRKQRVWKVIDFFAPSIGANVLLMVQPPDGDVPRQIVQLDRARIVEADAQ